MLAQRVDDKWLLLFAAPSSFAIATKVTYPCVDIPYVRYIELIVQYAQECYSDPYPSIAMIPIWNVYVDQYRGAIARYVLGRHSRPENPRG